MSDDSENPLQSRYIIQGRLEETSKLYASELDVVLSSVEVEMNAVERAEAEFDLKRVGIKSQNGLTKINDVDQTFTMDYAIFVYWIEGPATPGQNEPAEIKKLTERPNWIPEFNFYNAAICENTEESYYRADNIFYGFRNWTVTINEAFEIHRFPFDRQLLKITLYSTNCKLCSWDESVRLHPMAPNFCSFAVSYSYDTWTLQGCRVNLFSTGPRGPWEMPAIIMAERVPDFYLFNIVGLLFIVVMFAASIVAIDPRLRLG